MTAQPLRRVTEADPLRVLRGKRLSRPSLAPWMIMVLIGVIAFLGLGFARTSLDRSAFELSELTKSIDEATAVNQSLSLEIARLENPARIAPLAEDLGLVIPSNTNQLLVDLAPTGPKLAGAESDGATQ
jgi:cell division protein FtsL